MAKCTYVDENRDICNVKINDSERYCKYHRPRRIIILNKKNKKRRSRQISLKNILVRLDKLENKINDIHNYLIEQRW